MVVVIFISIWVTSKVTVKSDEWPHFGTDLAQLNDVDNYVDKQTVARVFSLSDRQVSFALFVSLVIG